MNRFQKFLLVVLATLISPAATAIPHFHRYSIVNAAETFKVTLLEPGITADRGVTFQDGEMTVATTAQLSNLDANTTHKTSDGTDHGFIDQDVTTTADASFNSVIGTSAGTAQFSGLRSVSVSPAIEIRETDASVDNKSWYFFAGAEQLTFRTANDGNGTNQIWLEVDRTGIAIDTVVFPNGTVEIEQSLGIGIVPVAGTQLTLPSENDAVTPTLAFGDGDSGFYERLDDIIYVGLGGTPRWGFETGLFRGVLTGAPALRLLVPSATIPSILPNQTDSDTGIGSAAPDQLSLIAGGVEQIHLEVTGNHIVNSLLDAATGDEVALSLNYTVNKATSGNDTGLVINQTDTASPGTSLLLDLRQGGTSRFTVASDGTVNASNLSGTNTGDFTGDVTQIVVTDNSTGLLTTSLVVNQDYELTVPAGTGRIILTGGNGDQLIIGCSVTVTDFLRTGTLNVDEATIGATVNISGHEGVSIFHDGTEAFITSVNSGVAWHDLTFEAEDIRFDLGGVTDKVVIDSAGKITTVSMSLTGDMVLNNATTTVDGAIVFDRTNEDLSIGDGTASQVVHMGAWKTWTPVFTGFSVDPTVNSARYTIVGKMVTVHLNTGNGTSNATTFTITLPVAAANTSKQHCPIAVATDNGTSTTGGGLLITRVNSTTADIFKDHASGGWTNVGGKKGTGVFTYESN